MLEIAPDRVGFIIAKSRAVEGKTAPSIERPGSNLADEEAGGGEALQSFRSDASTNELMSALDGLNAGEARDLKALFLIGRGDEADLDAARTTGEELDLASLAAEPLLGDHLAAGLSALGYSVEEAIGGRGISEEAVSSLKA